MSVGIAASILTPGDILWTTDTVIEFATPERGRQLLGRQDRFLSSLSVFDRSARLRSVAPVNDAQFVDHVRTQVLEWTESDRARLTSLIANIREKSADLNLNWPPRIALIKTTGKEEGGAGYCRGEAIVIPAGMLLLQPDQLEGLIIHEMFHIYTNHNPRRLADLYLIVGFRLCNDIKLPASLAARRITNPDAPRLNVYIETDVGDERLSVTPVLLARTAEYDPAAGPSLFSQMQCWLLVLENRDGQWVPWLNDQGNPRLLDPRQVPGYEQAMSLNTNYIIHPEEILAENFRLMVQQAEVPHPWVLERLRAVLTQPCVD